MSNFTEEFQNLNNSTPSVSTAVSSCDIRFNRYSNILPVSDTRINLNPTPSSCPYSDFINANLVDLNVLDRREKMILTQAPLPVGIEAFWLMVWQQVSLVVVSLNRLTEGGQRKGDVYWPVHTQTVVYGVMSVTLVNVVDKGEIIVRELIIHNTSTTDEPRRIYHVNYLGWPDFGIPPTTAAIREIVHLIFFLQKRNIEINGPPVIHCSAGVGRTGCFAAIYYVMKCEVAFSLLIDSVSSMQLETETAKINALNPLEIFKIVIAMREQRNAVTVQTAKQYEFIFQALIDEMTSPISSETVISKYLPHLLCSSPSHPPSTCRLNHRLTDPVHVSTTALPDNQF